MHHSKFKCQRLSHSSVLRSFQYSSTPILHFEIIICSSGALVLSQWLKCEESELFEVPSKMRGTDLVLHGQFLLWLLSTRR